jgi:hypothetical protein
MQTSKLSKTGKYNRQVKQASKTRKINWQNC